MNEIGLDPGIDHLMAHWLVADYRASAGYDADNTLSFISYCGGVPKIANPFRYKFSWSPLGVLTALRSPSRSIKNGKPYDVARPWDAISSYDAPLQSAEASRFIQTATRSLLWKIMRLTRTGMSICSCVEPCA